MMDYAYLRLIELSLIRMIDTMCSMDQSDSPKQQSMLYDMIVLVRVHALARVTQVT